MEKDCKGLKQQNKLRWYGHVLRKEDNDWVKKCMEYEVEGARPRGRPKKTWRDTTQQQPFYGSVEFVRENPGEPVPVETFTHYSHRSHQSSLSAFSI